jgi:hypothetical protein
MRTFTPDFLQQGLPVTTSPATVSVKIRWIKQPPAVAPDPLAVVNARLNADREEFLRLAERNTIKLTGKDRL